MSPGERRQGPPPRRVRSQPQPPQPRTAAGAQTRGVLVACADPSGAPRPPTRPQAQRHSRAMPRGADRAGVPCRPGAGGRPGGGGREGEGGGLAWGRRWVGAPGGGRHRGQGPRGARALRRVGRREGRPARDEGWAARMAREGQGPEAGGSAARASGEGGGWGARGARRRRGRRGRRTGPGATRRLRAATCLGLDRGPWRAQGQATPWHWPPVCRAGGRPKQYMTGLPAEG